jgi:hypothetical protein
LVVTGTPGVSLLIGQLESSGGRQTGTFVRSVQAIAAVRADAFRNLRDALDRGDREAALAAAARLVGRE